MGTYAALPGGELVERGLRDLDAGEVTVESLLLSSASRRLTSLGVHASRRFDDPEQRMWELLVREHGDAAHARLNSLRRELVSFQHACVK